MAKVPVSIRVDEEDLNNFQSVCETKFNREPQDVIREMIKACAEGRLKIKPTEEQKNERSELYHES